MKHRVIIEVPLIGVNEKGEIKSNIFVIQPPCFYCGEPISENGGGYFNLSGAYNIKFWGYTRDTQKPILGDRIDSHGNYVRGKYVIKIPYCPHHIQPIRALTLIDYIAAISGMLVGISLTEVYGREFFSGTFLFLAFILLPVLMGALFFGIGTGIKSLLPKLSPKFKDFAFRNGHYGICSHGVRVDGGKEITGPVNYWLKLGFCYPEGAQRFLESYPNAQVIKGKRFLARAS
jgi:hypothetical protein